jgi:hypothetical protein
VVCEIPGAAKNAPKHVDVTQNCTFQYIMCEFDFLDKWIFKQNENKIIPK